MADLRVLPGVKQVQDTPAARKLTQRGMDCARRGELAAAVRWYDRAILAADHLPALMNRACAYYHLGEFEQAVRDSSWALEVDGRRSHMWLLRGLARARLGDLHNAREDLSRCLELDSPHRALGERALRKVERALPAFAKS